MMLYTIASSYTKTLYFIIESYRTDSLSLSQLGIRVNVRLIMLTNAKQFPIALPPHRPPEGTQPLADLKHLALDEGLDADGRGPHVGDVEGAADAHGLPEAGLTDESEEQGGAEVEEGGGGAAVEVVETVCVGGVDGEGEGDCGFGEG